MAVVTSSWATLRFRRSKDVKGWALLGIPQALYPDVMQPLFERQTRFIEKHGQGEFVNVLFEAPVALAARLALAFPAPPSCEPLVVNQAGNRLLYGKFAQSAKARRQALESDAWPGLNLLKGDESFWQVVTTLSNVATLPLDRLHLPGENLAAQADGQMAYRGEVSKAPREQSLAAKAVLNSLVQGGLKLQPAAELTRHSKLENAASCKLGAGPDNLDDEGFEDDDWEDDEAESSEEETFEDVWDTDESADFWDVPLKPVSKPIRLDVAQSNSSHAPRNKPGNRERHSVVSAGANAIAPQAPENLASRPKVSSPLGPSPKLPVKASVAKPREQPNTATQPKLRPSTQSSSQAYRARNPQGSVSSVVASASDPAPLILEESETGHHHCLEPTLPQNNLPGTLPRAMAPASHTLGRYRSGLVPHASDEGSLQVYHSGGLTVADAIARSRQQEEAAQAIAEQAQRRRIKLPFEQPLTVAPQENLAQQESQQRPSWSYASHPLLPEESWAAAAISAQQIAPSVEPAWEAHELQSGEPWVEPVWEPPEDGPPRHNPWLPPSQQQVLEVESSQSFAVADWDGSRNAVLEEAADWGYYDDYGNWIACDPVMAEPTAPEGGSSALVLASTDVVCKPVEEEHGYILVQGVAVWNEWRLANPHIRPNLCGAYLNNLDLAGANLHDVDLRFALLFRADLREADLSLASLLGADLIRADLGGASLWGASLEGAYLSHANLAGADLTQADLRGAYWQGAILTGAVMPDGRLFEEQF